MITSEQITAALRKLGPASPTAIANQVGAEPSAAGYHLRRILKAKELIASGTSNNRLYALLDQKLDRQSAPPQSHRAPSKSKKSGHVKKKAYRAAPTARTAERFIPTVDVDLGLHIINGREPLSFNAEQTEAIATLLFNHYKA
jgi:DNA-binding transcriptional ArsR family regulator